MFVPVHRSGFWLLLGASAFLGLFAMHGLGGHGMNHAGTSGPHHADLTAHAVVHGTAVHGPAVHEPAGDTVEHQDDAGTLHWCNGTCAGDGATAHAATGSGGGHSFAVALCLVVLAAAAALAISAIGRLRPAVLGPPGTPHRVSTVLRTAVGHDPPTIFALSVQRC